MKNLILLLTLGFYFQIFAQTTLKDCSTCTSQIIKTEQIKDLSIDEIQFVTNDLFARKGYRFKNSNIDLYYSEKNWYKPVPNNDKIEYNDTEKQNIKLFQDRTKELKSEREKLISELKNFKKLFLQGDSKSLKSQYGYNLDVDTKNAYREYSGMEHLKYLTEVLNKINLDDINWIKHTGFYKVTVDNLNETVSSELKINKDEVILTYDYDSGSLEINESIYPQEYFTEFTFVWKFEWRNNQLKFVDLIVAG